MAVNDMRMSGFDDALARVAPSPATPEKPGRLRRRARLAVAIVLGLALGGIVGLVAAIGTGLIGLC